MILFVSLRVDLGSFRFAINQSLRVLVRLLPNVIIQRPQIEFK
jgi:hypothetical protein